MTTNLSLGTSNSIQLNYLNTNLNGSLIYYDLPASTTAGFSSNTAQNIYNSESTTCSSDSPCYGYYTYMAATANTGPSSIGENAPSDICPRGWTLPDYNTQVYPLMNSNGSGFLVAGGYYDSFGHYTDTDSGYWWSLTGDESKNRQGLAYDSDDGIIGTFSYLRSSGAHVRCVKTYKHIIYNKKPQYQNH